MSLKNPTTPGLLIDGQWSKAWSHSCRNTMWSRHGSKCWGHGFIYYIFMYVLNMYTVNLQARKFNPVYTLQEKIWCMADKKTLWMPGIYQVVLCPTWGKSPKFQAWQHGTYGFGDLWFGALFWTRLVSFGSETVQFFAGIVHFEPFSNDSWSVNHQPNMVIQTKNVVVSQKNCSPIDEQWEESSPFGWYIVIHHSEIKDMFGWFPFATNVMTSWWDHCNFNHDQWTEKDTGWYVALSKMWYSKPQIHRKDGDQEIIGETSSNWHPAYFPTYRNYCHSCSHKV